MPPFSRRNGKLVISRAGGEMNSSWADALILEENKIKDIAQNTIFLKHIPGTHRNSNLVLIR
jgi:hypothetical protein